MKKVSVKRIGLGILSLFILINLFLGLTPKLNADRMPGIGKWRVLSVLTGSMTPTIDAGDMVIVARYDQDGPAIGDIVTFWRDQSRQSLITHRVVQKLENGFIETRGDANQEVDGGWTPPDSVVGKVVLTIPYASSIQKWIQHPIGYLLILTIIAYLVYRDKRQSARIRTGNPGLLEEDRV